MASEHEKLVEEVEMQIRTQDILTDKELAVVIVRIIAGRTKEATEEMAIAGLDQWGKENDMGAIYTAMHRASPLWPKATP